MSGLTELFNWISNPLMSLSNDSVNALMNWFGSCYQGSCTSYPQEVWNQLGQDLSSVTGVLKTSAAHLFSDIFRLLPDGGNFPQPYHDAATYFGNTMQIVGFILPIAVLIDCVLLILGVKLGLWAFHIVRVGINFTRGIPTENYEWGVKGITIR